MIRVRVQPEALDVAAEMAALEGVAAGAIATFTGLVRADDGVDALELEHYPSVTEQTLERLASAAAERWALRATIIVHRIGEMRPGERIVFVGTAADHRQAALDATAYLIDRLKIDAPFWKRERRGADARWVEPRASDDTAMARWAADRP